MITPTHMMIGAALFSRRGRPGTLWASLAGGLLPDIPIFLMTLYATQVSGVSERVVFGTLYFSDGWQRVFSIDHGIVIWSALLLAALWARAGIATAFAGAGLAHALVDFATHASDARPQLRPLTEWVFVSPVSYWERDRYADILGWVEAAAVLGLTAWLVVRLTRWRDRAPVLVVALIILGPMVLTGGTHGLHGL